MFAAEIVTTAFRIEVEVLALAVNMITPLPFFAEGFTASQDVFELADQEVLVETVTEAVLPSFLPTDTEFEDNDKYGSSPF